MQLIQTLTNDVKQKHTIILPDNTSFILQLEYKEVVRGWFYGITYQNYVLPNAIDRRLITFFNILHQYKNILPFGIAVSTDDYSEPIFLNDFISGRVVIEVLTSDEVKTITNLILTNA